MVADKQEEVAALEMKLQTLDKDLEWKKEIMAKEYQKSSGTAQGLEECVQQMRAKVLKCEEAEEQQKEELKVLKLRAEGNKVKLESEKEEYSTFILKACQVIKEHKILIQVNVNRF